MLGEWVNTRYEHLSRMAGSDRTPEPEKTAE